MGLCFLLFTGSIFFFVQFPSAFQNCLQDLKKKLKEILLVHIGISLQKSNFSKNICLKVVALFRVNRVNIFQYLLDLMSYVQSCQIMCALQMLKG